MTCPHPRRRIDGAYEPVGDIPMCVAFSCLDCGTSGAIPWPEATDEERAEATELAGKEEAG